MELGEEDIPGAKLEEPLEQHNNHAGIVHSSVTSNVYHQENL